MENKWKRRQADIDTCIYQPDHLEVVEARNRAKTLWLRLLDKSDVHMDKEPLGWKGSHEQICAEHGLRFAPCLSYSHGHIGRAGINPAREDSNPFYATLKTRQKSMLDGLEQKFNAELYATTGSSRIVFCLNRSFERAIFHKPHSGIVPCITSGTAMWLDWEQRLALPGELLAMQGLPLDSLNLKGGSKTTIVSLAGNAVANNVTTAVNLSVVYAFGDVL